MKRRALLGSLAATAFAGCTGYVGERVDDTTTTEETTTETTTDEQTTTDDMTTTDDESTTDGSGDFPYRLGEVCTGDPPFPGVAMGVTVERQFTHEHPAVVRVAFTNKADRSREFQFGSLAPWDSLVGGHEDGASSLLLAPGDSVVPDEPAGDCWRATDGVALPAVMRSETVDPGETVAAEFHVLAAHDSENCLEPGTYRFEDENYLERGWGFSVDVAERDTA